MKVVVIGCTHAGTAAVQEILNRDPETEVAVYERNADISFLSCGIYLYLGGVVRDLHDVFFMLPGLRLRRWDCTWAYIYGMTSR